MSRQVAHGTVWFPEPITARVLDLMKAQSSAARSAYQAAHKHGLKGNAVKQYVKRNFMNSLNQNSGDERLPSGLGRFFQVP